MNKDDLIDKIKLNKRYLSNEDLLESFLELINERVQDIINIVNDDKVLDKYIDKVVSKSIIEVLKENNRYVCKQSSNLPKINYKKFNYNFDLSHNTNYSINDLKRLYTYVNRLDESKKSMYLDVIMYRYKDHQKLAGLINTMDLSASEVVKILFEMSDDANRFVKYEMS